MISRPSCVSLADRLGITVCEAYDRMESLFYVPILLCIHLQSYGVDVVVRQDLGDFIAIAEVPPLLPSFL